MRWLLGVSIGIRVLAAAVLVFGPWTDRAAELAGWDVERFQAIADLDGRPWVDEEVEYPPGSVVLIELVGRSTVVGTHRLLVALTLAVDLGIAATLHRRRSPTTALAYLLIGLPLVPMGLLRFDLVAAALALAGALALVDRRDRRFGLLVAAGAAVKVWPALLVAGAAALGRWRAAWWATAIGAVAGVTWLGWAGGTIDPLEQVISLRGATGWHLESIPGSLVALFTADEAELQLNAYRIGALNPTIVLLGRALTVAVAATLVIRALRSRRLAPDPAASPTTDHPAITTINSDPTVEPVASPTTDHPAITTIDGDPAVEPAPANEPDVAGEHAEAERDLTLVAVVVLGAVTALIVTAPLLSPQFLLWLTPWAALTINHRADHHGTHRNHHPARSPIAWLVGAATLITGTVLLIHGPAGVGAPAAAVGLLIRDGVLLAVIVACIRRSGTPVRPSGTPAGAPLLPPTPSSS